MSGQNLNIGIVGNISRLAVHKFFKVAPGVASGVPSRQYPLVRIRRTRLTPYLDQTLSDTTSLSKRYSMDTHS
jgi:hypothetical protein